VAGTAWSIGIVACGEKARAPLCLIRVCLLGSTSAGSSVIVALAAAGAAVYLSSLSARVCLATLLCMLGVVSTVTDPRSPARHVTLEFLEPSEFLEASHPPQFCPSVLRGSPD
jgi:hypothetical protein